MRYKSSDVKNLPTKSLMGNETKVKLTSAGEYRLSLLFRNKRTFLVLQFPVHEDKLKEVYPTTLGHYNTEISFDLNHH